MMPTLMDNAGFPRCISLRIEFNPHATLYQSLDDWLRDQDDAPEPSEPGAWFDWVSPEERVRALATDRIWICRWYQRTPVGFGALAASTFEALMAAVNTDSK